MQQLWETYIKVAAQSHRVKVYNKVCKVDINPPALKPRARAPDTTYVLPVRPVINCLELQTAKISSLNIELNRWHLFSTFFSNFVSFESVILEGLVNFP